MAPQLDATDLPDEDVSPPEEQPKTLVGQFRSKFPNAYKDMKDADLEKAIITKWPQYKDHAVLQESLPTKVINALKPAERIHPSGALSSFIDSVKEGVKGAAETALPSTTLSDYWKGPAYALRHPIDSAELVANALYEAQKTQLDKAKTSPTLSEKIGHGAAALLPVLGPAAANAGENIAEGNTARGVGQAAGILAPFALHALGSKIPTEDIPAPSAEELPIRQSVRTDLGRKPLVDATPQQEAVAISLTKDRSILPRNAKNISVETGIPQPLVRRTLSELKQYGIQDKKYLPLPNEAPDITPQDTRFIADDRGSVLDRNQPPPEDVTPIAETTKSSAFRKPILLADDIKLPSPDSSQAEIDKFVESVKNPEDKAAVESAVRQASPQRLSPDVTSDIPIELSDIRQQELLNKFGGKHEVPEAVQPDKTFKNPFKAAKPAIENPELAKSEEAVKAPYTIDNAPPNQRAKMMRGAHEPVDILFNNPNDREIFGAGQRTFKNGVAQPNVLTRFKEASERVAKQFDITPQEARSHIIDYNAEIRKQGSAVDPNGGNITAPSFEDFVKSRTENTPGEQPIEQPIEQPNQPTQPVKSKWDQRADDALVRIKARGTFSGGRLFSGLPVDDLADLAVYGASKIASGVIKFADWSAEMIKDFGNAIKPHLKDIFAESQSKHAKFEDDAFKKFYNGLVENKGATAEQAELNTAERAKRFSNIDSIKTQGTEGAARKLAAMRGEFPKTEPGGDLRLDPDEKNALFNVIHRNSKLSAPEQLRAHSALFTMLNGDRALQPNEIELLDKVFSEHLKNVAGPGASGGYDIGSSEARQKISEYIADNPNATKEQVKQFQDSLAKPKSASFSEATNQSKKPDDFLTKLANFSSGTTRMLFGAHIPKTAISFHGINEVIRHTAYGTRFIPTEAAGRFAEASKYLIQPGKAQEFLNANLADLGKAVEEGGLMATTGDIGNKSLFKGTNFVTKGINYITDPKALFDQMIPALKLKQYQNILEYLESTGLKHEQAAKMAGYTANNIFGGLNWKELQVHPTTVKLMRASQLAPDWLTSNALLGKETFNALKNPMSPQARVYQVGIANFLGSYVALNAVNAMNNNGKFMFQNEPGHELDLAYGQDSAGRTRYFSPYGTAMDMVRIPLEIAHAAVGGNMGRTAELARSRASEPLQFATDLATNTDYAGRSLYNKTKYGKPIPGKTQVANIAADAAGHFLPVGVESGINLAQGKVSPEQFASQVLQLPMKYKMPYNPSSLRVNRLKAQ